MANRIEFTKKKRGWSHQHLTYGVLNYGNTTRTVNDLHYVGSKNCKMVDIKCSHCHGRLFAKVDADLIRSLDELRLSHKRRCRTCVAQDRLAGLTAALAVAERKKRMGIRW